MTRTLRQATPRTRTPSIQVIRTTGNPDDPRLYGALSLTPREALVGTRKLVNLPWGFQSRTYVVTVPPGVREGTLLRLAGMGRQVGRERGDLHLRISIHS